MRNDLILAEQSVAGSILVDERAYHQIADRLKPDDFLTEGCRDIFVAAGRLSNTGKPVDLPLIQAQLADMGSSVDGRYLIDLMEITPTAANVHLYADLVAEDAVRRRVRALCQQIAEDDTRTTKELLCALHSGAEDLLGGMAGRGCITSSDAMLTLLEGLVERGEGRKTVLSTGFRALDKALGGGLSKGALCILAGRPGMGKTTLALCLAENLAKQGTVLYISLEMTADQLSAKRIARRTGIPAQRILLESGRDAFQDDEMTKITSAASDLCKTALVLNQHMGTTLEEIALLARSQKNLVGVVVDHLGLIRPREGRSRSRTEIVTEISAGLKELALSLDVPVLALSQLNRASEQSQEKRPSLAHLRDSGTLEQDADVVMLLYRPDYYEERERRQPWTASLLEVDFAKNRFGSNQTAYLNCYLATDRITEV